MTAWMPDVDKSQDFSRKYTGSIMSPRIGVIHTTEGTGWPSYGGGKSAPHFTVRGNEIRQHFPVTRSARALVNKPGGVETNTSGAIQVEIIGTSDPSFKRRYPAALLVPDADADDLAGFLRIVRWLEADHGVPAVDAAPRGWLVYGVDDRRPGVTPASYGASPARMSGREWLAARGWVGHQHVPENSHGDPGNFPIHLIDDLTAKPKGTFVKNHYARADKYSRAEGRPLEPGQHLYLHESSKVNSQATNIVGGIGPYSITTHLYAEGSPGDVLELVLVWQNQRRTPLRNSDHYVERLVLDRDGQVQASREFKRGVADGDAVFLRVRAADTNSKPVTVTRLDSDAYLFGSA